MTSEHKKAMYNLAEGWLELESDPGLFTLLMEDMGVEGVQVEEIYDLQSEPLIEKKPCYGAIFLFRWIEDRRSRRKIVEEESLYVKDEEKINQIFFAQQIVPNSCATHALVSILLNCPQVKIGDTLQNLKNHTQEVNPENKGLAIGNSAQLAYAHNSHAVPRARRRFEKSNAPSLPGSRYTGEAFHFVSYVPINNRLIELDGLRKYPIDHGPIEDPDNWTEKLREVIQQRLGMAKGGAPIDIRFALMVLVPESRKMNQKKLKLLEYNRNIILKALKQLLDLYKMKKQSGEKSKSGRSTRSSNGPPKYTDEDEILYLDPGTSEEAMRLDKDVSAVLGDFQALFKEGVRESDTESIKPKKNNDTCIKQEKEEKADVRKDDIKKDDDSIEDSITETTQILEQVKNEEEKEKLDITAKLSLPDVSGKPVNKPLLRVSRGSSAESTQQPLSPFQSNPLLTAHDYSKSPLMEGCEEYEETQAAWIDDNENDTEMDTCDNYNESHDKSKDMTEIEDASPESTNIEEVNCDPLADDDNLAADPKAGPSSEQDPLCVSPELVDVKFEESMDANQDKDSLENGVENADNRTENKENNKFVKNERVEIEEEIDHRWPLFSYSLHKDYPDFDPSVQILRSPNEFQPTDLLSLLRGIECSIYQTELTLRDEMEKHNKFVSDDCRRVHDYDEFINTFLFMLAEQDMLADLVEHGLGFKRTKIQPELPPKIANKKPSSIAGKKKLKKKSTAADDSESDWSDEPSAKQCKVLYTDTSLPKGWKRRVKKRGGSGLSHSKYTVTLFSPEGKSFRTKGELRTYLEKVESDLKVEQFDFSVTGNKRTIGTRKKKEKD